MQCTGLQRLDLGQNSIDNYGIVAVMGELKQAPHLHGLRLKNNYIDDEGIKVAVHLFAQLTNLEVLCLEGNLPEVEVLGSEGARALNIIPSKSPHIRGICADVAEEDSRPELPALLDVKVREWLLPGDEGFERTLIDKGFPI